MVHDEAAQHRDLRHGENRIAVRQQGPGFEQFLVAGAGDSRSGFGNVGVECFQQLGLRLGQLRARRNRQRQYCGPGLLQS